MTKKVKRKVLLIGFGSAGVRHLGILKELANIDCTWCPSNTANARHAIHGKSEIQISKSLEHAVTEKPDFAIVANHTEGHLCAALILARAGIPFFLEKPVSNREKGLQDLLGIVEKTNLPVLVGYNLRYHPCFESIRAWLQANKIGSVISLLAQVGQWLPDWRPERDYRECYSAMKALGGGVVLDLSHEIDLSLVFLGPAKTVVAVCEHFSPLETDTEDLAEITIIHEGNRLSHLHLDCIQRSYSRSLKIIGSKGSIFWDYVNGYSEMILCDGEREGFNVPKEFDRDQMFRTQMVHWLDILDKGVSPKVSLREGIAATRVALAALESSEKRRYILL
jgi:predicted dehydrogenase